jgi:hypothetical protein
MFAEKLEKASSLADIFELVKEAVGLSTGRSRAGIMLGLAELSCNEEMMLGAFFPVGSNIIVMNRVPLEVIAKSKPEMLNPYSFYILLHEYLHSLGVMDERSTREETYKICMKCFGEEHLATQIAKDFGAFLPYIVPHLQGYAPPDRLKIELVKNFDRSSVTYIN